MHPLDTECDREARAQRQDAATEAAQHRNDAMRPVVTTEELRAARDIAATRETEARDALRLERAVGLFKRRRLADGVHRLQLDGLLRGVDNLCHGFLFQY